MRHADTKPLRRALLANGVFSSFSAVLLLAMAEPLSPHLADLPPLALRGLAVGLLLFVPVLGWCWTSASSASPRLVPSLIAIGLDLAWVLASVCIYIVARELLTPLGATLLLVTAVAVAVLGAWQWQGVDRALRETNPSRDTTHRISIHHAARVSAERLWPVVADLAAIAEHMPELARSALDEDRCPAIGAVRRCASRTGEHWAEEVTRWHPGHEFEVLFRTEDQGFPFPMRVMSGGWRLDPIDATRSRVTVWWSFTTQPAWLVPFIAPLMERRLRPRIRATIDSMVARAQTAP